MPNSRLEGELPGGGVVTFDTDLPIAAHADEIADLIKHLPMRYETHHGSMTIKAAEAILGERERMTELVTIEATITTIKPGWRRGRKSRIEASGESSRDWSVEFQCPTTRARAGDASGRIAPASLQYAPARSGGGIISLLSQSSVGHCLL